MTSSDFLYVVLSTLAILFLLKKKTPEGPSKESKEEILKLDDQLESLSNKLKEEEKTRSSLEKEMTEKTNEVLTAKELADFFNDRKP